MPTLTRIHRLLKLLQLLQSGRKFNSLELADQCQVSRRTIFRDLRTLQDSGIPLHFFEDEQGYSVQNKVVVPPTDFTLDEALSLVLLCNEVGNPEHGIPFQHSARSAGLKLLSGLSRKMRKRVQDVSSRIEIKIGPTNLLSKSKPIYDILRQAIIEQRQVRVKYRSFTEGEPDEITTLLNPYRLLFGRRAWYVFARSSIHRAVRTFSLGRILHAEKIDSTYKIPQRFTLSRYLGNAWFLIREQGNRQKVVVRFQPMVAENVAEVQWHKTQKLNWRDDGQLDLSVSVDGLNEISWWILGYGDQAEVIEPPALRKLIRERIKKMHRIYGTSKRPKE